MRLALEAARKVAGSDPQVLAAGVGGRDGAGAGMWVARRLSD